MANAVIQGRQTITAFKKGSAWGTAVACGAGDGIRVMGGEMFRGQPAQLDEDSLGILYPTSCDQGATEAGGPVKGYARYDGFDVMLAMVMGTASTPTQLSATSAYSSWFKMKDDISGLFGTLAQKIMSEKTYEYPSLKLYGLKHTFKKNIPSELEFTGRANKKEIASATNTYSTMASVTYPSGSDTARVIPNAGHVVWVNDASGGALSGTDAIKPTGGEITINRPQSFNETANATAYIDEPLDNGIPEVTVKLDFPNMSTLEWQAVVDSLANTSKKMLIKFVGNLIDATQYYNWFYYFPNLKYQEPMGNAADGGQIPFSVTMKGYGYPGTTGPTGMATASIGFELIQPVAIYLQNKRATSPLA